MEAFDTRPLFALYSPTTRKEHTARIFSTVVSACFCTQGACFPNNPQVAMLARPNDNETRFTSKSSIVAVVFFCWPMKEVSSRSHG
jgi:hypothetical protein